MNAELLYTSAPQGLKQGSRGFCTVLSTVGMPLNLATKLESLSGYRHLYPSGTPDASKNPVGFSHLRFMSVAVMSRFFREFPTTGWIIANGRTNLLTTSSSMHRCRHAVQQHCWQNQA